MYMYSTNFDSLKQYLSVQSIVVIYILYNI